MLPLLLQKFGKDYLNSIQTLLNENDFPPFMFAAKTELKHAQAVKEYIQKKKLMDYNFLPVKEFGAIYFPLLKKVAVPQAAVQSVRFSFPQKKVSPTVEDSLKNILSPDELQFLPKSQEVVGTILILEIPEKLRVHETLIAEAYLKLNKHLDTVVRKDEMHEGTFRTRTVKILAGKMRKETIHQESGVLMKLHLERTYFSARLGNERLRIAKQVKPGEDILVMFSGVGPYPLVLARRSPARHILGIEINPWAHVYAVENVQMNNLQHKITIQEGDVRDILPPLKKKFDRVVMPLPKTGEEFLSVVLPKVKKRGMIHLYAFLEEKDFGKEAVRISKMCKGLGYPVRILKKTACGQFSPGVFRVCFDMKVL